MCTSRQRLRVAGERVWTITLLALPDHADSSADELAASDALALFADRAAAADDTFRLTPSNIATVAEICSGVDGLPLGIEIAAANIGAASPVELLARFEGRLADVDSRLHGIPDRHRSLANAIRWSYEMLGTADRLLLERLSVVESPIRTTDVIAMGFADSDVASELLAGLADKSLLERVREGNETD